MEVVNITKLVIDLLASSHARVVGIFFQPKKKCFYFENLNYKFFFFEKMNLIYKQIKQFEKLQESSPIFQAIFQQELELDFYQNILQFCFYLNIPIRSQYLKSILLKIKTNQLRITKDFILVSQGSNPKFLFDHMKPL